MNWNLCSCLIETVLSVQEGAFFRGIFVEFIHEIKYSYVYVILHPAEPI